MMNVLSLSFLLNDYTRRVAVQNSCLFLQHCTLLYERNVLITRKIYYFLLRYVSREKCRLENLKMIGEIILMMNLT